MLLTFIDSDAFSRPMDEKIYLAYTSLLGFLFQCFDSVKKKELITIEINNVLKSKLSVKYMMNIWNVLPML